MKVNKKVVEAVQKEAEDKIREAMDTLKAEVLAELDRRLEQFKGDILEMVKGNRQVPDK